MATEVARLMSELVEQMTSVYRGLADLSDTASTRQQRKRLRAIADNARSLLGQIRDIEPAVDIEKPRDTPKHPPSAATHGDKMPRPHLPGWGEAVQSWLVNRLKPYEIERLKTGPNTTFVVVHLPRPIEERANIEEPAIVKERHTDTPIDAYVDSESLEVAGKIF